MNDNIRATISTFSLGKGTSIYPKPVQKSEIECRKVNDRKIWLLDAKLDFGINLKVSLLRRGNKESEQGTLGRVKGRETSAIFYEGRWLNLGFCGSSILYLLMRNAT